MRGALLGILHHRGGKRLIVLAKVALAIFFCFFVEVTTLGFTREEAILIATVATIHIILGSIQSDGESKSKKGRNDKILTI